MGRYTTLDEEMKRLKRMALITEQSDVKAKEPCGCDKPEDNREIITSSEDGQKPVDETIKCSDTDECRLVSHTGKNLGHGTKGKMEKREKQVNYFKHLNKEGKFNDMLTTINEAFDKLG